MHLLASRKESYWWRRSKALNLIALGVFLSGLLVITNVLFAQVRVRNPMVVSADAHVSLLIGITFVYLASLLRRAKYTAWLIALPLYGALLFRNFWHILFDLPAKIHHPVLIILNLVIPTLTFIGLIMYQHQYTVRSETRSLPGATRRAILVLLVAFLYGIIGFQLLDSADFHQEISIKSSAHYTIDQFGLTSDKRVIAHTKRAHLFIDSLGFISVSAVVYVVISFFGPIRFRFTDQSRNRNLMKKLLEQQSGTSEDFFKLWPYDKAYYFTADNKAGLAYRVVGGVALVVGDPAGQKNRFSNLIESFSQYCSVNDWEPAFIHTEEKNKAIYEKYDFSTQKIGEEAVVDLTRFTNEVATNKYFRNINSRFSKQKYYCETLNPPQSEAILNRLNELSDDWLKKPGRSERTFMLGHFDHEYLKQCPIMVVRDEAKTILAFINQIPSYDPLEANFDLLRNAKKSPTNLNDYLMINFISYLQDQGKRRLNMGLSPLSGLNEPNKEDSSALNSLLSFVYSNGDRFYSFSGLRRFKAKYEPDWQPRYVVFRGGLRGFTKAMNSLVRAMRY